MLQLSKTEYLTRRIRRLPGICPAGAFCAHILQWRRIKYHTPTGRETAPMQEEKSFVYTLILGICMLLCLLMIGRMMLGHPEAETQPVPSGEAAEEQEEQNVGFQLSEEGLREMIAQALPFAPDDLSAAIRADQTISVSANVQRQTLADSGLVPGNLRTALLFCRTAARFRPTGRLRCRMARYPCNAGRPRLQALRCPRTLRTPCPTRLLRRSTGSWRRSRSCRLSCGGRMGRFPSSHNKSPSAYSRRAYPFLA